VRALRFPILVVLVALFAAGCSTNRKPLFDVDGEGQATAFRRYTDRPAVDHVFRWNKRAFQIVEADFRPVPSPDRNAVLARHGKPDYFRTDVRGERLNELFDEWVYWNKNVIVQFIDGKLVYEGALLDSDRWLIRYGFPSRAYSQQYEIGPRRETWIYEHLFRVGGMSASFSNGELVFQANY
jgi:hypothetical protein